MSKSAGSFFRKFFKLIFSLAGFVAGALAVILMVLPATQVSATILNQTVVIGVSGFAWAFGGSPVAIVNGEVAENFDSFVEQLGVQVEANTGVMIALILLIIGAVLGLIYVLFSWGKKNPQVKKGIGLISALVLLVGAILCFFIPNFVGWETGTQSVPGFAEVTYGMGPGAILGGILGILGFVLMGVATLLGPKEN